MITDKDEELIALLRLNAREPVASLARKLGVSRTTVQDRLKRLEAQGTIAGYSVKLARDAAPEGISAFITLTTEPRKSGSVTRDLARFAQIETVFTVSGKFDIVAYARCRASADMDKLLDAIGLIDGVQRTESAIVLSTKLDRR